MLSGYLPGTKVDRYSKARRVDEKDQYKYTVSERYEVLTMSTDPPA
jgi:hypothetical protein